MLEGRRPAAAAHDSLDPPDRREPRWETPVRRAAEAVKRTIPVWKLSLGLSALRHRLEPLPAPGEEVGVGAQAPLRDPGGGAALTHARSTGG